MFLRFSKLSSVLFLDIETVSITEELCQLGIAQKAHWKKKATQVLRKNKPSIKEQEILYREKAGIYSEFSKVICISVGFLIVRKKKIKKLKLKSFYGEEKKVLLGFVDLLNTHFKSPKQDYICGHNIREFDIPFLCRRMLIHKLKLPNLLQLSGRRPWQITHLLDTLDLWRFGDYKHYVSLSLLADVLGIPSPKNDMDGSQVHAVFWEEHDIVRIAKYCEQDVVTVAKLLLQLNNSFDNSNFSIVSASGFSS